MNKYEINEEKYKNIMSSYPSQMAASIYGTHVKIAASEYAKYLNELNEDENVIVEVGNTGIQNKNKNTFVIKKNDLFVSNTKFINKCIVQAQKKRLYLTSGFFKVNIVLDILKDSLQNRK